ncbi:hypothetical protein LSTR_LSTR009084 [Laodelphax striatellus]|uniref:BTB domain-containing protein n=1 Tax=Laodelphax striatellus TaxID=195883 RepID=A0A482XQ59_LAOST|nr:hypothetical protein LSTR_LSTR009084 [Laodelphax striatellus]
MDPNSSTDPDLSKMFEKRFLRLLEKDIECDCEFVVGSQKTVIKGHKLVFSAASEVFHAMFYGELKEEQSVRIEDIDPEVFQGMRRFIYTGEVKFTSSIQALLIYIAARKYIINPLSKKCISFIQEKHIQPSEVLEFVEICKIHCIQEFEEFYNKVIQENTDKVVESDYFLLARPEVIELILKSPSLNLNSEIDVFQHFERWVIAEAGRKGIDVEETMTGSIGHLKKHIRFLSMSSDDFLTKVVVSSLLTPEEKVAVACNLKKVDSKSMPKSISLEVQPRSFITTDTSLDTRCYANEHVFLVLVDDPNCCSFGECNGTFGKYNEEIQGYYKYKMVIAKIPKSKLRNRCFSIDNASNIVNIRCSFNIIVEK